MDRFLAFGFVLVFAGCGGPEVHDCPCPRIEDPVCGVDGNTYGNACDAACVDVEVEYFGECSDDCVCTEEYQPVCGVDGRTHGNACFAACANKEIAYEGECVNNSYCSGDWDCAPNQYCDTSEFPALSEAGDAVLSPNARPAPEGICRWRGRECYGDEQCADGQRCQFDPPPCEPSAPCASHDNATDSAPLVLLPGYCVDVQRYCWDAGDCLPGEFCQPADIAIAEGDAAPPFPGDPLPPGICQPDPNSCDDASCEPVDCRTQGCDPNSFCALCPISGDEYGYICLEAGMACAAS